jgi:predicted amidohydrolase YtcJ
MPTVRIENATVWTGSPITGGAIAISDSVLFEGGRILALGATAKRLAADEVIDAAGGFICAGFGDGHVHPVFGGLEPQFAPIRDRASAQEIAQVVGKWAKEHPTAQWIRGEGFDHTLAPNGVFLASWLDAEVPDRPVVLRATDYHTVWVNSEALRRAGYQRGLVQPHDGEIVLDEFGDPTGTLREWGAWRPVYALLPEVELKTRLAAIAHANGCFAAAGLTWIQDAWVEATDVDTWIEADRNGLVTCRVAMALWADPNTWRDQVEQFVAARAQVSDAGSPRLVANTIKFFADGVIESATGALLEPYCDCPHSKGMPNWQPDELKSAVAAIDALGFQTHIHAIGDGAARMALDAIEHASIVNGARDRRPVIAHTQLVSDADLGRFAELGVIANFEPYWAKFDSWQTELTEPRLGAERTNRQFMIRTILRSGAPISFGSDWPVTTYAPLAGIQVAVTRKMTPTGPTWMPQECLTVEEALLAYTSGVAFQAGDESGGVIRPGARADLVWLAADPRGVDPMQIENIAVLGTWAAGHRVWQ